MFYVAQSTLSNSFLYRVRRYLHIFSHPTRKPERTETAPLAELQRLAALSPHLLEDIGFLEDPRQSSPSGTIRHLGALRVRVDRETGSVEFQNAPGDDRR